MVIASEATIAAALPAKEFVKCIQINEKFAEAFSTLSNVQESYLVAAAASHQNIYQLSDYNNNLIEKASKGLVRTLPPDVPFSSTELQLSQYNWFLSTDGVPGYSVGSLITEGQTLPRYDAFTFPYRLIGVDKLDRSYSVSECLPESEDIFDDPEDIPGASLLQLGILDGDLLEDNDNYPVIKEKVS